MSRVMIIENQSLYVEMRSNASPLSREDIAFTMVPVKVVFLETLSSLNIIWGQIFPEDTVYR